MRRASVIFAQGSDQLQRAPLVKEKGSVSAPSTDGGRKVRNKLLREVKKLLPNEAVRLCGSALQYQTNVVKLKMIEGDHGRRAIACGLNRCTRIWDCPVCAANIAGERRKELGELIRAHEAAGGQVWMTALTMPHSRLDEIKALRSAVSGCWRQVQSGRAWKEAKQQSGLMGTVRALEVTHGQNGWHPHLHILFFFERSAEREKIEEFGKWLFQRWADCVSDAGHGDCNEAVYSFERARSAEDAANYAAKWGSEWEMLGAQGKTGKNGNKTPWQLLHESAAGNRRSGALFVVYAMGMKGARQLTYSKGLRATYKLSEMVSDAEIDAERERAEQAAAGEDIGYLSCSVFFALDRRNLLLPLLEAVEQSPAWATVLGFLRRQGIEPDLMCSPFRRHWFDADAA